MVVEFDLKFGRRRRRYWMVLKKGASSLCLQHPGFDNDLEINAHVSDLQKVYMGRTTWAEAVRNQSVVIEGAPALVRKFPKWMLWSHFSGIVAQNLGEK